MNKYFTMLIGVLVTMLSFPSCTDQDDIDISYEQSFGITAVHLFDNYEPFRDGDFDMSKDGWKLNLQVLIYDENCQLVDKAEKLCNSMSETLNYIPSLTPGEYTVVSIADFREGLGGSSYKFWEISNIENLQDISITENQNIYPVVFETIGIDIQNISVTNKPQAVSADIKPTTSLVQVFMSDGDYSGWGIDGYSRFCVLADGYFIKAIKFRNNIRFENGELNYKYSEQVSDYNIAISETHKKWIEKKASTGYNYRALLPEENKGFSFHIQKRKLPQEDYNTFVALCGEFDADGKSNILPEIASNKQYVVNMIFDAMQLVATELTPDYTHESYTKQFVIDYNKQMMEEMVNTKFESMLGKDENYANAFLDNDAYDHDTSGYPYTAYYPRSRANHFEQYVTTAYLNIDFSNLCIVQLLLPDLTDDSFAYLKELMSEKFSAEEEGKFGPNYFTYIERDKPEDDSRYRVVLEKKYNAQYDKYIYFLSYNLRQKYY